MRSCTFKSGPTQPPRKPPPLAHCRIFVHQGKAMLAAKVHAPNVWKKGFAEKTSVSLPQNRSWTNQQLGALSHSNTFLPKKIINPTKTHSFRSTWMRSTKTYCYLGIVTGGFKMGSLLKMYKWLLLKQKTIIHINFPGVLHSPPKKK